MTLGLAAQLPVLVHPVEPVRQPARADLQKAEAEVREADRDALHDHAREVPEQAHRKRIGVDLGERAKLATSELSRVPHRWMHGERDVEPLGLFVDGVVHRVAERHGQPHGDHLEADQAKLGDGPPQLFRRLNRLAKWSFAARQTATANSGSWILEAPPLAVGKSTASSMPSRSMAWSQTPTCSAGLMPRGYSS